MPNQQGFSWMKLNCSVVQAQFWEKEMIFLFRGFRTAIEMDSHFLIIFWQKPCALVLLLLTLVIIKYRQNVINP